MSALTAAQVEQFHDEGYLVVDGLIDAATIIDPLVREYERVLDDLARSLHARGLVADTYADLAFGDRFTQICQETNETNAQHFDFSLPQGNIRVDTPMCLSAEVFRALVHPPLLDAVESIIGSEIYSNPVQHIRIKPPEGRSPRDAGTGELKMGATNWHQDNGVVLPVADESEILTAWFSLADAGVEHGCLQVIPRSHRLGLLTHCPAGPGGLSIPERVASRADALSLPTKRGDVVFLHMRTIHSSLPNVSDVIRWSFDLRYNPIGQETGRGAFPGFVARSRSHPEIELGRPQEWADLWLQARARLAEVDHDEPFNRWSADAPACA